MIRLILAAALLPGCISPTRHRLEVAISKQEVWGECSEIVKKEFK